MDWNHDYSTLKYKSYQVLNVKQALDCYKQQLNIVDVNMKHELNNYRLTVPGKFLGYQVPDLNSIYQWVKCHPDLAYAYHQHGGPVYLQKAPNGIDNAQLMACNQFAVAYPYLSEKLNMLNNAETVSKHPKSLFVCADLLHGRDPLKTCKYASQWKALSIPSSTVKSFDSVDRKAYSQRFSNWLEWHTIDHGQSMSNERHDGTYTARAWTKNGHTYRWVPYRIAKRLGVRRKDTATKKVFLAMIHRGYKPKDYLISKLKMLYPDMYKTYTKALHTEVMKLSTFQKTFLALNGTVGLFNDQRYLMALIRHWNNNPLPEEFKIDMSSMAIHDILNPDYGATGWENPYVRGFQTILRRLNGFAKAFKAMDLLDPHWRKGIQRTFFSKNASHERFLKAYWKVSQFAKTELPFYMDPRNAWSPDCIHSFTHKYPLPLVARLSVLIPDMPVIGTKEWKIWNGVLSYADHHSRPVKSSRQRTHKIARPVIDPDDLAKDDLDYVKQLADPENLSTGNADCMLNLDSFLAGVYNHANEQYLSRFYTVTVNTVEGWNTGKPASAQVKLPARLKEADDNYSFGQFRDDVYNMWKQSLKLCNHRKATGQRLHVPKKKHVHYQQLSLI